MSWKAENVQIQIQRSNTGRSCRKIPVDTLRCCKCFWSVRTTQTMGCSRNNSWKVLKKLWRLYKDNKLNISNEEPMSEELKSIHKQ